MSDILADVPRERLDTPIPSVPRLAREDRVERLTHALRGVELGVEDISYVGWYTAVMDGHAQLALLSWLERVREQGRQEMIAGAPNEHDAIAIRIMADHVGQLITDLSSARAELQIQRAAREAAEQRVAELEAER